MWRRISGIIVGGLLLILSSAVLSWHFWRPGLVQLQAYRILAEDEKRVPHAAPYSSDAASSSSPALTARWFGVSAVLLQEDTASGGIFIDPFFSRSTGVLGLLRNARIAPDEALVRQALKDAGITDLDAVVVSHSHYDHAMDAGLVARLTGAVLIGSPSTLNIGRGAGLSADRLWPLPAQAGVHIGRFQLQFVRSRHAGATGGRPRGEIASPLRPPARISAYRQGGTYSILITHPGGRVLHHGSAGFVPGALEGYRADIAFLGVALIEELQPYLQATVRAVQASAVIPVHWDDFTRSLEHPLSPMPFVVDLPAFIDGMRVQPDLSLHSLDYGQRVRLDRLLVLPEA